MRGERFEPRAGGSSNCVKELWSRPRKGSKRPADVGRLLRVEVGSALRRDRGECREELRRSASCGREGPRQIGEALR